MLSIAAVSDADYYLRGGCHRPPSDGGAAVGPAEYELDAVARGEPPGVWLFTGENHLGVSGEIKADAASGDEFRTVLNQLRHPVTGEQLGRAPLRFATPEERLERFRRRHPDATPEQVRAEKVRVQANRRQANHAWDSTFSPPKSWSVLHAAWQREGLGEDADVLWECLEQGIRAALQVAATELGFTRTGFSGPKVAGRATTRYVRNEDFQAAMFRHHLSRERDPQLHAHVMLLNRVLCGDGEWRALYSPALLKSKHMLDAVFLRVAEGEATRRLGLRFAARPDGKAREILGVSQEARDLFSTRSRVLGEKAQELADAFTAKYGRVPDAFQRWQMRQHATRDSRRPKPEHPPSREEELAQWEEATAVAFRSGLAGVVAAVDAETAAPNEAIVVEPLEPETVIAQALADLEVKSTWTRSHLVHAINMRLPDMLAIEPARVWPLLEEMADAALAGRPVVAVTAPNAAGRVPASLTDRTGRSVFEGSRDEADRFTTRKHLEREDALVARLEHRGAPAVPAARARSLLAPYGLSTEQLEVATAVLASDHRLVPVDAPAGTGKSRIMAALSDASTEVFGHGLTGFSVSQNAAEVLAREGVSSAHNIAAWLDYRERAERGEASEVEHAQFAIPQKATVVLDEASMVGTPQLTAFLAELDRAGAGKVVVVGDTEQVDAVEAGGAFALMCAEREPHTLGQVRRFSRGWERDASARIRTGDVTALTGYDARQRLQGDVEPDKVVGRAVGAFVADHCAGRETVLVVSSGDVAADVSSRVRRELVAAGLVESSGVTLHDENVAGLGDVVATRWNRRDLGVVNRDTWQVVGVTDVGDLEVRRRDGRDENGAIRWAEPITLPAWYVAGHVELAYAGTVEAVQGRTTDTAHALIDRWSSRSRAYPALTRGRDGNWAWIMLDGEESPVGRMADVLATDNRERAARTVIADEQDRAEHLGHLGPQWQNLLTEDRAVEHRDVIREVLGEHAAGVLADPASGGVFRLMRAAESQGFVPGEVLASAASSAGSLGGAVHPAAVLYGYLDEELSHAPFGPDRRAFTYAQRTPAGGGERMDYARRVAEAMDRRVEALGERVADESPPWAVERLGEVPADPVARAGWAGRAGAVEAYREQFGWHARQNPIGPQPTRSEPERLWVWSRAADVLGMDPHERDMASLPDAELANRVQAWARTAAWLPRNVDVELREAWAGLMEAQRQEVATRGTDAEVDAGAVTLEVSERVGVLEEIAEHRARLYEAKTPERERAEEAGAEQRRRQEQDVARGGAHPDDPGPVEPEWDPEFDDVEPEPATPAGAESAATTPVWDEADTRAAVFGWWSRHGEVSGPRFGSRTWCELDDDDPAKAASVTAAAVRMRQLQDAGEADLEVLRSRLAVRDVEEPVEAHDVEVSARTQFWAEDHGLDVDGPVFGSDEWAQLPDDDPGKVAGETVAAVRWHNGGDDLDAMRERAEEAERVAREADLERLRAEGAPLDVPPAEPAPGGEVEEVSEPVADVPVDRSRYAEMLAAAREAQRSEPEAAPEEAESGAAPEPPELAEDDPEPDVEVPTQRRWTVIDASEPPEVEPEPEEDEPERSALDRDEALRAELVRAQEVAAEHDREQAEAQQREDEAIDARSREVVEDAQLEGGDLEVRL